MAKDSFLWHKVSEQEKEEIKKNAKSIMDNFAQALSSVEKKAKGIAFVERDESMREETKTEECDSDFRKIMFKNAPETEGDCIKAEKGKWTE